MSEPTNAGEARTGGEEPRVQVTDDTRADSEQQPHLVRLVFVCLSCGSTVCEWREAPGHPGDCVACRNPPHLEGHE
jgi:hypothetical protein